jgi:DNA repair ATPase RecN
MGDAETEVATVLRNDAHSLSELEAGRCTYVKMTDVTFKGLRQALRFPDTRVRHKPPGTQLPVLHAIRIRGGTGALEDVTVAFSPNLSCLIGARGTGKSAIVDAIRYVFGYNREMGKRIGDDLKKQVESRQQATLTGTTIELLYSTESGELYALSSVYDAKRPYVTMVSDREGRDTHISDAEKDGRFPCRLYGWSEVEHLGRRADHQRDLLDHMLGLHSLVAERDKLLGELSEERIHIEALATGLERDYEESGDLQRLRELQQSFDFIKKPDVEPLFVKLDSTNQDLASAKRWEEKVTEWLRQLERVYKPPQPILDDETNALWKAAKGEELMAAVQTAAAGLIALGNDLVAAATQLRVTCEQQATAAARELAGKLEGKADVKELARKRATIGKQLDSAREQERQYDETLATLMSALAARREKVSRMRELCKSLSASRNGGIGRIGAALSSKGGPSIGITMSPGTDTARYEAWLSATLKSVKPYQTRDRIIAAFKAAFGPEETTSALLQGSVPGSRLRDGDAEILRESVFPFFVDESSGVKRVRPGILAAALECDECPSDDYVEVTLDGRPIGDLSPGQRCSALLPIILLGSEAPLVLDQPEDNLDNQLITDLLIQTLHRLKEHRQVIVVTHSPNIVVTGDAEQVVVMEAGDGRCRVRRQASVDRVEVMRDIVDLMEGGREALRRRFKRYWPEEDVPELSFLNDTQ